MVFTSSKKSTKSLTYRLFDPPELRVPYVKFLRVLDSKEGFQSEFERFLPDGCADLVFNHYAQLTAPGITIGLHPTTTVHHNGNSGNLSIGFTADDFDRVKSLLSSLSIPHTLREEEGGHFQHFSDPDGTSLYFIKPK